MDPCTLSPFGPSCSLSYRRKVESYHLFACCFILSSNSLCSFSIFASSSILFLLLSNLACCSLNASNS